RLVEPEPEAPVGLARGVLVRLGRADEVDGAPRRPDVRVDPPRARGPRSPAVGGNAPRRRGARRDDERPGMTPQATKGAARKKSGPRLPRWLSHRGLVAAEAVLVVGIVRDIVN